MSHTDPTAHHHHHRHLYTFKRLQTRPHSLTHPPLPSFCFRMLFPTLCPLGRPQKRPRPSHPPTTPTAIITKAALLARSLFRLDARFLPTQMHVFPTTLLLFGGCTQTPPAQSPPSSAACSLAFFALTKLPHAFHNALFFGDCKDAATHTTATPSPPRSAKMRAAAAATQRPPTERSIN